MRKRTCPLRRIPTPVVVALVTFVVLTLLLLVIPSAADAHVPARPCSEVALTQARAVPPATRAEYRRNLAACKSARARHAARHCTASTTATIRCVFGAYGSQAVSVAMCESTLRTTAQNGQYLGLFQMGSNERATYGHGTTALAQSRAAHRYFVASGRDWSPWACKP